MTDTIDAGVSTADSTVSLPPPIPSSTGLLPPPTAPPPTPAPPVSAPPAEPVVAAPPSAPIISGPSAIFSSDAPVIALDHGAPTLPSNTPAAPSATSTKPAAAAFSVEDYLGAESAANKTAKKSGGRWIRRLLVLGLLGAAGWVGVQHGPALYDTYVRGDEAGVPVETEAPLAFPNVAEAQPIRTAEFVLVGLPDTPNATYRVTTDFETSVSQVDITREAAPDLQILTYGNDAMIRRAGAEQWYLLERGQFPLDGRLQRADWVRRIDELLPAGVRDRAAIDASTEATVSGVSTRHLSLTLDLDLLGPSSATDTTGASAPPADDASQPEASTEQAAEPATTEPIAAGAASTGETTVPGAATNAPSSTIQIEVWIDGEGLVRQVSGAPQLGAETITVVSTSAEAWIPDYPTASMLSPLTASALVELGI